MASMTARVSVPHHRGDLEVRIEQLKDKREDLELELEIVNSQMERYIAMNYSVKEPQYRQPIQESSCHHDDDPFSQTMEEAELCTEVEHLQIELGALKRRLAVYQKQECARLSARREAALEKHRRDYKRLHPSVSADSLTKRQGSTGDEDEESDYDTID